MSWISTPTLVSAVSNAGGLGILATGPLSEKETNESILEIKKRTRRRSHHEKVSAPSPPPFGVGITLLMPGSLQNLEVSIQNKVPVINLSLGKPPMDLVQEIKSYNGQIISTVTTLKHAEKALEYGADALMITGNEAAAHGGDKSSLILASMFRKHFGEDIPLISAGGFTNGQGLLAALSLGVDGIALGTRFAITQESPLSQKVKDYMSSDEAIETIYGDKFDGIPARVLKTDISQKAMSRKPPFPIIFTRALKASFSMKIPLWKVIPGLFLQPDKVYPIAQFGAATQAIQKATVDGDLFSTKNGGGVQFSGQGVALIQDEPKVEDLVCRIIWECHEAHKRNQDLLFTNE